MADIIDQLMDYLSANQADPGTYLVLLFLYSIASAIILPIPVEIALVINPSVFFPLKALDVGLGKMVGAIAVFFIPSWIRAVSKRFENWGPIRRMTNALRAAAEKTGLNELRLYRAAAGFLGAIKAAVKKSGINRSRIYGKMQEGQETPPAVSALPRWGWLRWIARKSERLVRRFGVIGMYVLLSIPGMPDTVILYIFAIINMDRTVMTLRDFALANLLAGINRVFIIFALLEILGIRMF
jgi:hypothetical protein